MAADIRREVSEWLHGCADRQFAKVIAWEADLRMEAVGSGVSPDAYVAAFRNTMSGERANLTQAWAHLLHVIADRLEPA